MLLILFVTSALAYDYCPVVGFVGEGTAATLFEDTLTGELFWEGSSTFEVTPNNFGDPTMLTVFANPYDVISYGSTPDAWGAGVDTDGYLWGWGTGLPTGIPSGEEPYSSPQCGSTGRCAVLDATGHAEVWFNTSGSFGTPPAAANFDVLAVGREVGCAADSDTATGVTCWGSNADNLVSNPAKPGSGYQIVDVAVARYVAVAVDVYGNTYCWRTSRSSMAALANEFCANRPMNGIATVDLSETGELFGVAHHLDGTATIWQPNDDGNTNDPLTGAPGWDAYGRNGLFQFKPKGPDGEIVFRSIGVNIYHADGVVGVIEDPMDLVEGYNVYEPGDVLSWDSDTGPQIIETCW